MNKLFFVSITKSRFAFSESLSGIANSSHLILSHHFQTLAYTVVVPLFLEGGGTMKQLQPISRNAPDHPVSYPDDHILEDKIDSWRSVPGDVDDFIFSMQEYFESER